MEPGQDPFEHLIESQSFSVLILNCIVEDKRYYEKAIFTFTLTHLLTVLSNLSLGDL